MDGTKIADDAIGNEHIATDAVNADSVANNAIDTNGLVLPVCTIPVSVSKLAIVPPLKNSNTPCIKNETLNLFLFGFLTTLTIKIFL